MVETLFQAIVGGDLYLSWFISIYWRVYSRSRIGSQPRSPQPLGSSAAHRQCEIQPLTEKPFGIGVVKDGVVSFVVTLSTVSPIDTPIDVQHICVGGSKLLQNCSDFSGSLLRMWSPAYLTVTLFHRSSFETNGRFTD